MERLRDEVLALLDQYPSEFLPLADAARNLLDRPGYLSTDGVLSLGNRPWVAPENYAITLYPGLPDEAKERYCQRFNIQIPAAYAKFLATTNGAFCHGMSLAGIPRSMTGSPPLLDRARLQCHDLATAVTLWSSEYRKRPANGFHFGSRHYSARENVGYFMVEDRIISIKSAGRVIGEWELFSDFLRDELQASEVLANQLDPVPPGQS